ncbi:16247_t:CDS:1, partial [Cetraspora pellucida]
MSFQPRKSAKLSAKRCEAFLKITAGSNVTQLVTKRAAVQPVETTGSASQIASRTSD